MNAQIRPVTGLALDDAKGNLYIAEAGRVRKVSPSGIITTFAGTGTTGAYSGNEGPATKAQLYYVMAIATDQAGNVYLADQRSTVRKIDTAGTITLFAGSGGAAVAGFRGDSGPATKALLAGPTGLAVDGNANVYIADSQNARVREIANALPILSLKASPVSGQAPLAVSFDASGSRDPDGSVTAYRWDFGDGATAAGKTARHSYPKAGTYTVKLTLTDDSGAHKTASRTIQATTA